MARPVSMAAPILWLLIAALTSLASCANNIPGGALNVLAPHLANTAASWLTGTPMADPETPRISLKIVPSKHLHLTPSEMNALLFTIRQEIHRKARQLEEDLLEYRHDNEKHLSAWALNQAPVYMPFRDNSKPGAKKHEPTLQMAVKRMKEKAASNTSAGKPAETPSVASKDTPVQESVKAA